jgi:hypothetical protein
VGLHETPEVASTPLKVTVPTIVPKFVPLISSHIPTGPELGLKLVMLGGGGVTVKLVPLLSTPPTVTTTFPVAAFTGTSTVMLVAVQLLAVPAAVPLNVTVLEPCDAPKFAPVIVTEVPTGPEPGLRLVMLGGEPPPAPAALKAASAAPQLALAENVALADMAPAAL